MQDNIIIMTVGLAGSSVLTQLLARGGYWTGDNTAKKADYDTHENAELVRLDKALLARAGVHDRYMMEFEQRFIDDVAALYDDPSFDRAPYRAFAARCAQNRPWIWKDPRLWMTIHYWQHFVELATARFVIIRREPLQDWVSCTLRRQIQTYAYMNRYTAQVLAAMRGFIAERGLGCIELTYEDLTLRPQQALERINAHVGLALTLDDLRAVYTRPLGRKNHGLTSAAKAALIYAKNYPQRYR